VSVARNFDLLGHKSFRGDNSLPEPLKFHPPAMNHRFAEVWVESKQNQIGATDSAESEMNSLLFNSIVILSLLNYLLLQSITTVWPLTPAEVLRVKVAKPQSRPFLRLLVPPNQVRETISNGFFSEGDVFCASQNGFLLLFTTTIINAILT
jgi:hypothetical protein